jgi:CRISPR-associated protein Csx17
MPELILHGCTPEPLMSYLKALGILRLVAEQADPEACGAWHAEAFALSSQFDREALIKFFLEKYRPTPILAPWKHRPLEAGAM